MCYQIAVGLDSTTFLMCQNSVSKELRYEEVEDKYVRQELGHPKYKVYWVTKGGCSCDIIDGEDGAFLSFIECCVQKGSGIGLILFFLPDDLIVKQRINTERISIYEFKKLFPKISRNTRYIVSIN